MKYIVISFLLLSLLGARNSFAQIDIYRNVVPDGNIKLEHNEAKNNKNEIEVVFSGLFLFYKTFFSSQDLTVCTFSPSCSEFGILAVKKFGVIKGGVMTMDRLTRCNGLSPSNYEIDKKTMLLKDDPGYIYRVPVVSSLK
ncbi:MAG: membrane protein insertion efficiency factor YidD [Cytophagaceae bacterium]|nr:membrane protein insertion efficiency factor YidD [Cytophagaceae bacterium]MBK9934694.1 membrane protein insertion efficiency factor YidD [Cytophagaceae bacterium]MBL0301131.1 membrane protein insertion efficiency factor YidD [Cytophagaceae bacterium]MBL0323949.1 membrane protein insertion efficiency factor YidD [Cytophagaceae bacterium]